MADNNRSNRPVASRRSNLTVALTCVVFVGCMLGAAYAAVPLYQLFCQVTGFGGTTQVSEITDVEVIDRKIAVNFDANVSSELPWEFKPVTRKVELSMGEVGQISYVASNIGSSASSGVATFNVVPFEAGVYFNKLECFCFLDQQLAPGESMDMPVVFFVDPEMDKDPNLQHIKEITLSYTFFSDRKFNETNQPVASVSSNPGDAVITENL